MRKLLESIYGSQLEYFTERKISLPVHLTNDRVFYGVKLCGAEFFVVEFQKQERLNISSLKKLLRKYQDTFQKNVVFAFPMVTTSQRKSLIENNISFIAGNEQIFMPFIGMYFNRGIKQINSYESDHLMPATQMLYLLLLYSDPDVKYSRLQAADIMRVTAMSVTRAAKQLKQIGILAEEKNGTEIMMSLAGDKKESFLKVQPYLINPIQSVVYAKDLRFDIGLCSGELSLSKRSEYGQPEYKEYAIYKGDELNVLLEKDDLDFEPDESFARIQKWKYDPQIFGNGTDIDPVSLWCTLKDRNDERIRECLEQVKGEIVRWELCGNHKEI